MRYISSFFDQSGEIVDEIDVLGAETWLDIMGGSIDLLDGEEHSTPPWGEADELVYSEPLDGANAADRGPNAILVHINRRLGYASITARLEA